MEGKTAVPYPDIRPEGNAEECLYIEIHMTKITEETFLLLNPSPADTGFVL